MRIDDGPWLLSTYKHEGASEFCTKALIVPYFRPGKNRILFFCVMKCVLLESRMGLSHV